MIIHKYIPARLYGFVIDEQNKQYFFHLCDFQPGDFSEVPIPPILGESVEVEHFSEILEEEGKAPRLKSVKRKKQPYYLEGTVESFDPNKGYGFLLGDDQQSYYLHRCEVLHGKLPLEGNRVSFYVGSRNGKSRACYVRIKRISDVR